jgi:hypothetical protein
MTSTTTTSRSRAAPTPSSFAASRKFKAFATTFSISGTVVYCLVQYFNYPLLTYWPATHRLVFGYEGGRAGEGPNMLWYGWTITTILIAGALGIVAMMLPERITNKIPLSLVWIFPILAIPYIIYSLMPWWTLAAHGH